jgi:hypothetical protein
MTRRNLFQIMLSGIVALFMPKRNREEIEDIEDSIQALKEPCKWDNSLYCTSTNNTECNYIVWSGWNKQFWDDDEPDIYTLEDGTPI